MNRDRVLRNARLAGAVKRYHTWPTLTQQSVAEHTFHLMRIWWQLWGPLPPAVSSYFLWHDLGEILTGDLPFPVKSQNPELKRICEKLEGDARHCMGGPAELELDDDFLKPRLKCCDLIEMLEFGLHERRLGNVYAQPIITDTLGMIRKLGLSDEDQSLVTLYLARLLFPGEGF